MTNQLIIIVCSLNEAALLFIGWLLTCLRAKPKTTKPVRSVTESRSAVLVKYWLFPEYPKIPNIPQFKDENNYNYFQSNNGDFTLRVILPSKFESSSSSTPAEREKARKPRTK